MEIKLVNPTVEYSKQIMEYRQCFIDNDDNMAGCGSLRSCLSAKEWLDNLNLFRNQETCPTGFVPSTTFLAVRITDNKLVGIIDFRHHIDHPILSVWGGHIGYSVYPHERKKGYAKEMLSLALVEAKKFGLSKVLITCDVDNIGSEKTILANGGVFEKIVYVDDGPTKRYWITLQ